LLLSLTPLLLLLLPLLRLLPRSPAMMHKSSVSFQRGLLHL
jgi:hypothetical protein